MVPEHDDTGFDDDTVAIDWDDADSGYAEDADKGAGETDFPEDDYLVRIGTLELNRGQNHPHRYFLSGQLVILKSTTKEGDEALVYAGMNIWSLFMLQGKPFSLRLTRQLEEAIGYTGSTVRELANAAQESTVRVTTKIERSKEYGASIKIATISAAMEEDLQFATTSATDVPPF